MFDSNIWINAKASQNLLLHHDVISLAWSLGPIILSSVQGYSNLVKTVITVTCKNATTPKIELSRILRGTVVTKAPLRVRFSPALGGGGGKGVKPKLLLWLY